MLTVFAVCVVVVSLTTVFHYEVLGTLNGLLLVAWSASFTYLSMERFWSVRKQAQRL